MFAWFQRRYRLTFLPAGRTVTVKPGESLLEIARRERIAIPAMCQGEGSCRACLVHVTRGGDRLTAPSEGERAFIDHRVPREPDARLACLARIDRSGDVTVQVDTL